MYPQQYQDFLDFLDSNPAYRRDLRLRLLSPELIALPEQFAQLVATVTDLTAKFEASSEVTNRRLTAIESDVDTLKSGVAALKSDVAALKGSDLERRARESILNIAKDELYLTRGRILLARGRETAPAFLESLSAAEENGRITEGEVDNILVSDIIIRARRAEDRRYVHAVFEVAHTIQQDDIRRARSRAATVAAATGEPTIAAVIGEVIQPLQRALADETGVRVLRPALLRQSQAPEETAPPDG